MRCEYIRQLTLSSVHVSVVASRAYPPYTPDGRGMRAQAEAQVRRWRAEGRRVEVIAESDERGEEFIHLDADENLVHRICASRSYLFKAAGALSSPFAHPHLRYATRLAEKLLELTVLWNRRIDEVQVIEPRRGEALLQTLVGLARPRSVIPSAPSVIPSASEEPLTNHTKELPRLRLGMTNQPMRSLDVIVPTYNRYEELRVSLPGVLDQVGSLRRDGIETVLTVVHQNEDLPAKLGTWRPEVAHDTALRFVFSSPPGLTRARNAGLAATSGDLVVFVDDDVLPDAGFLRGHLDAALAHRQASGVAGRVLSRGEGRLTSQHRAVGQIRLTGFVDTHFESDDQSATLVPLTPMGVNMSYRRAAMDAWFGPAWFDEGIAGSAFREETTLALEVFRRGGYFVFAPQASLFHLESSEGGSLNRDRRSLQRRIEYQALEYRFLRRFYRPFGPLAALASLGSYLRDLQDIPRLKTLLAKSYIHGAAYLKSIESFSRAAT
jgi:GT2 family glycosyltransferase